MSSDRPDPRDFIDQAQRMLRQLFGESRSDDEPWGAAAGRSTTSQSSREPSPQRQRENLTFALATRAVEALEDLALNVAAIRQRLERTDPQGSASAPRNEPRDPDGSDAEKP